MFLLFMMGHHFGVPFHKELQKDIIRTALSRITDAKESGDIYFYEKTWAEARLEGKEIKEKLGISR
jgi:predicted PP-loop superfamily ATPase